MVEQGSSGIEGKEVKQNRRGKEVRRRRGSKIDGKEAS